MSCANNTEFGSPMSTTPRYLETKFRFGEYRAGGWAKGNGLFVRRNPVTKKMYENLDRKFLFTVNRMATQYACNNVYAIKILVSTT